MDAEISMDSELEGYLEVVHHEFGWESGQGSHLCTINFEVRNASSTHDIWFDAVGEVVDENGTAVGGDVIQFGLHPQEEKANTFSVDNCAAAAKYRITFEARGVSESSNTGD
ncbi:hypothetical protein [Natrinema soli]|uniref:DUF4352 domain-containing protein n=1 Tax=Natrinema soli TaxID=1930624 RepID=A0ABD5ST42_9EURY|nr:hypothetical protein [Natrinema soli]